MAGRRRQWIRYFKPGIGRGGCSGASQDLCPARRCAAQPSRAGARRGWTGCALQPRIEQPAPQAELARWMASRYGSAGRWHGSTVQAMEDIGQGYVFAACNLGLAFADSREFGFRRSVGWRLHGLDDDGAMRGPKLKPVSCFDSCPATHAGRNYEIGIRFEDNAHVHFHYSNP
jgi:hypothetical protein